MCPTDLSWQSTCHIIDTSSENSAPCDGKTGEETSKRRASATIDKDGAHATRRAEDGSEGSVPAAGGWPPQAHRREVHGVTHAGHDIPMARRDMSQPMM